MGISTTFLINAAVRQLRMTREQTRITVHTRGTCRMAGT